MAGSDSTVGQRSSAVMATDTPRPSKIPATPLASQSTTASTRNCYHTRDIRAPLDEVFKWEQRGGWRDIQMPQGNEDQKGHLRTAARRAKLRR